MARPDFDDVIPSIIQAWIEPVLELVLPGGAAAENCPQPLAQYIGLTPSNLNPVNNHENLNWRGRLIPLDGPTSYLRVRNLVYIGLN